jgi:hypothetical protein
MGRTQLQHKLCSLDRAFVVPYSPFWFCSDVVCCVINFQMIRNLHESIETDTAGSNRRNIDNQKFVNSSTKSTESCGPRDDDADRLDLENDDNDPDSSMKLVRNDAFSRSRLTTSGDEDDDSVSILNALDNDLNEEDKATITLLKQIFPEETADNLRKLHRHRCAVAAFAAIDTATPIRGVETKTLPVVATPSLLDASDTVSDDGSFLLPADTHGDVSLQSDLSCSQATPILFDNTNPNVTTTKRIRSFIRVLMNANLVASQNNELN